MKAEIQDVNDEHVRSRQELEQTQNELTRELKFKYVCRNDPIRNKLTCHALMLLSQSNSVCVCVCRYLIIENFIPPEEKNKIMNRLTFDTEEDQWKFQPLVPSERCGRL